MHRDREFAYLEEKTPFFEALGGISIRAATLSKFGTAESIGVLADV
jgi:hypothetical protein